MQIKKFFSSLSYSICQRTLVRAGGASTILLRVIINRNKKDYNLNVSWPRSGFDKKSGKVTGANKNDPEAERVNLVISDALARAHNIQMQAFAGQRQITHDEFSNNFLNYQSRENFIWFWQQKIDQRLNDDEISSDTARMQRSSLNHSFVGYLGEKSLPFNEINERFIHQYTAWLRRKYVYNTKIRHLKTLQTYLKLAQKEKLLTDNPMEGTVLKYREGFREALEMEELTELLSLLDRPLQPPIRAVLIRFLFSCFTGFRISDNKRLQTGMIRNGSITVRLKKGDRYGTVVQVPLPEVAKKLIENSQGMIFKPMADQTVNDTLKIIAGIAGIEKRLTFHVSRDTFGTLFIEMGGDLATLKDLMGHANVATTMKYVKMSEKRKEKLMSNFDKFFGPKPGRETGSP